MAQTTAGERQSNGEAETTITINPATEDIHRQTKRLAPSFPVLLPPTQVHGDYQTSPKQSSSAGSARGSPTLAPQAPPPSDPNHFLTTLAAQERRVLELREELYKAESDLAGLKKQWAAFEANRKKSGIRHVEQLQPLNASHLSKTESGGDVPMPLNALIFEKLAAKPTRKPQQRVFSGSRHTRTLSLLTTASGETANTYPEPLNNDVSAVETIVEDKNNYPTVWRSSTMPGSEANPGFGRTYKNIAHRRSMPPPPPSADALVKTGKQMASDLRDGLWTFFEDIRQATVGDEGVNGTNTRSSAAVARYKSTPRSTLTNGAPRKRRSNTALESPAQKALHRDSTATRDDDHADDRSEQSFWKEFGVDTPERQSRPSRKPPPKRQEAGPREQPESLPADVDDDWDTWESPVSHQKTFSWRNPAGALPDSKRLNDGTDALPWPELTKSTP